MGSLRERLQQGETLIGSIISVSSPDIAEVMALAGFDYLWIEGEHAPMGFPEIQTLIQAIGARCPSLVRIPENRNVWFKKALDTGCDGVIVPQVNSAGEAQHAIECALYPPEGRRSVGITRAQDYGASFDEYVRTINQRLLVVLQVEHVDGVDRIEEIVRVPGIGAILIGPYDLSGSLGLLGQTTHPDVETRIERVRTACAKAGVPLGIFAIDAETANRYIEQGFQLILLAADTALLMRRAREELDKARGGLRG